MARARKTISVDDLWQFERVGALALSPDGAQAVCTLQSFSMEENKGQTSLWLLSTFGGGPRRLTSCGEKDGQPAWSPTGERIAFLARREQHGAKDETQQLYVIAPDGGEARRISDFAPGIESFKWLPGGQRIAFVAWVWPELRGSKAQAKRFKEFKERKESAYVTSEAQYRYWDHSLPMGRVPHLHLLDLASGRIVDLFEGTDWELSRAEPDAHCFDVSPDGQRIVFAHDPGAEKRLDNCRALAEIELRTRRVATVAHDKAWDLSAPRYSPDGARIAVFERELRLRDNDYRYRLIVLPADGGEHRVVADAGDIILRRDQWAPTGASIDRPPSWSPDSSSLAYLTLRENHVELWRVSAQGGVYEDPEKDEKFAETDVLRDLDRASDRIKVVGDDGASTDITRPLDWLIG